MYTILEVECAELRGPRKLRLGVSWVSVVVSKEMPEFARVGSVQSQQAELLGELQKMQSRLEKLEGSNRAQPEKAAPKKSKKKWTEEVLSEGDSQEERARVQNQIDELIVYNKWKRLDKMLAKIPQHARLSMIGANRVKLVTLDFDSGEAKPGLNDEEIATLKVMAKWGAPVCIHTQEVVEAP